MKLLSAAALTVLCLQNVSAQTVALDTRTSSFDLTGYPSSSYTSYYHKHKGSKGLIIGGGAITSVGAVVMGVGLFYESHLYGYNAAEVAARQEKAKHFFIGGGVIMVIGGIMGIIGVHQVVQDRLGVEIITPKNNEIGFAYNF